MWLFLGSTVPVVQTLSYNTGLLTQKKGYKPDAFECLHLAGPGHGAITLSDTTVTPDLGSPGVLDRPV